MRLDNFLALFRFYFPPYYPNTDFFHTGESCMSPVYHEKLYTPFYKIRHRRLRILCVIYANPFDVVKMIHVILLRGVAFHFNSFFGFACTYYLLVEENVNVSKLHSPLHFEIIHFLPAARSWDGLQCCSLLLGTFSFWWNAGGGVWDI